MSESVLTDEALAEQLKGLLSDELQDSDLQWSYRKAASVLSFYNLEEINPFGGLAHDKEDAVKSLLPDSYLVHDENDQPQWSLRSDIRKEAIRRLHADEQLQEALKANPHRTQDTLQEMLDAYIFQRAPDLGSQSRQQLLCTLQVADWLQGTIEGVPEPEAVRRKIEMDNLLAPFQFLVGKHFRGRQRELNRLSDYVGVQGPSSISAALTRGIKSIFSLREQPPLFIYGPGGIGKSTLLAKFILDHAQLADDKRIPFAYLDFDRPSLIAEEPLTLLLEALRQLEIQYPESGISLRRVRESWMRRMEGAPQPKESSAESLAAAPKEQVLKDLNDALLDSLTPVTLMLMLSLTTDRRLEEIVNVNNNFQQMVYEVVSSADKQGWLKDLVRGALRDKPDNLKLQLFASKYPELNPDRIDFRIERRSLFLDEFAEELASLNLGERSFLLILDTFEEVQCRSRAFVGEVFEFLNEVQGRIPSLRTVLSGRAEPLPGELKDFQTENLQLSTFDAESAQGFLLSHGIDDPILASRVAAQVGGYPLTLKLAAQLLKKEAGSESGIRDLKVQESFFKRLKEEAIQGLLYRRILEHIRDPKVRALAHPGLILRRITPELILEVLAKPCQVDVPDIETAQVLFNKLSEEVALVTQVDSNVLIHRQDLRNVMLDYLKESARDKVEQIHELAAQYYEKFDDDISRAEEIYHRLSLGLDRQKLDSLWRDGLGLHLGSAVQELPPRAQAYLAARLNLVINEETWKEADLEDWELYTANRARDLLSLGQPSAALRILSEREERSAQTPLLRLELESLLDVIKQMQDFYIIYSNNYFPGNAMLALSDAIRWCVENLKLSRSFADEHPALFEQTKAAATAKEVSPGLDLLQRILETAEFEQRASLAVVGKKLDPLITEFNRQYAESRVQSRS